MIEVKLDRECWSCSGTGKQFDKQTHAIIGACLGCHGTGRSFTDAGMALRDFLEMHYGLTPSAITDAAET